MESEGDDDGTVYDVETGEEDRTPNGMPTATDLENGRLPTPVDVTAAPDLECTESRSSTPAEAVDYSETVIYDENSLKFEQAEYADVMELSP